MRLLSFCIITILFIHYTIVIVNLWQVRNFRVQFSIQKYQIRHICLQLHCMKNVGFFIKLKKHFWCTDSSEFCEEKRFSIILCIFPLFFKFFLIIPKMVLGKIHENWIKFSQKKEGTFGKLKMSEELCRSLLSLSPKLEKLRWWKCNVAQRTKKWGGNLTVLYKSCGASEHCSNQIWNSTDSVCRLIEICSYKFQ